MPNAKPFAFVIMVLWLGLLFSTIGIAASDFFCVNLSTISSLLGMSESLAGVTFLAFGNGSPDVFSTFAAMSTHSGSLAVGELIGAAGFITAVVAGSMAIVRPFKVTRKSFVRDVGFFIVAASFSMIFLYDGVLYLWECLTMVGIYIFYVVFVILWHWRMERQKKKKSREAMMRTHYVTPGGEEADVEPYHDEEDTENSRRTTLTRGLSADDFSALERGGDGARDEEDEIDEELLRERLMGELSNSMRLSRPRMGERRNTQGPIRPSLVGALEFRAVLSSLKRSRNMLGVPLDVRPYSDNPGVTVQSADAMSTVSDPATRPYTISVEDTDMLAPANALGSRRSSWNRARAVSVNDADGLEPIRPSSFQEGRPPIEDLLGPLANASPDSNAIDSRESVAGPSVAAPLVLSPSLAVTPPSSVHGQPIRGTSVSHGTALEPNKLAPPESAVVGGVSSGSLSQSPEPHGSPDIAASTSPQGRTYPKLDIPNKKGPGSTPNSPFPAFDPNMQSPRPPTLLLPSPSASPDSYFPRMNVLDQGAEQRPVKSWPYSLLPPPGVLVSTLFPTLYSWKDKNVWEKFLGIVATPSVFLLTITLPVVESETSSEKDHIPTMSLNSPTSSMAPSHKRSRNSTMLSANDRYRDIPSIVQTPAQGVAGHSGTASTAIHNEDAYQHPHQMPNMISSPGGDHVMNSPDQMPATNFSDAGPKDWNRWLIIVQCFTAPFFVVLVFWANTAADQPRALLRPALISLIVSLVLLLVILLGTSPSRAPRWRPLLCFAGFFVAIAWISTIANEVVGVLKTLGVVLDISDAILGLTVFAVGNSLGDLVADITVARLGFPVMALSACLGGPMMNILLGIGLSGSYITINGARKRQSKHPGREVEFRPYRVHISSTLVVSGAALMVTLAWLMFIVPLRRWRMDRFIGWSLVALWATSTIGNVVMEVVGFGNSS